MEIEENNNFIKIYSKTNKSYIVCSIEMFNDLKDIYGIDLTKFAKELLVRNEEVNNKFGSFVIKMHFTSLNGVEIKLEPLNDIANI